MAKNLDQESFENAVEVEIVEEDTVNVDLEFFQNESEVRSIDLEIKESDHLHDIDLELWQDEKQIIQVDVENGYYSPADIHYGDTLEGDGSLERPINVSSELVNKIENSVQEITGKGNIVVTRSDNNVTIADTTYVFDMGVAQNEWIIVHNLNKKPSVVVVDSAENVVTPETEYVDNNTVIIKTNAPFKGKAYLN